MTTSTRRCGRCVSTFLPSGEPDESGEQKIAEWEHISASRVERARRTLNEIRESGATGSRDAVGGGPSDPPHDAHQRTGILGVSVGFVAPVPVRWSDIDMYQHVNHATMVTILEESRVPFLKEPFGADIATIGLLIADVRVTYKDQLRLVDSPLQVTIWTKRLRAVDFTLGYEVRSVNADPESKPAVIAESQLAAVHIEEQRLVRLSPHHREYLQRWHPVAERGLWLGPTMRRTATNLAAFVEHAMRLDEAAVIRIRARSCGIADGMGRNGFRRAGQSRGGRQSATRRHVGRRGRVGPRAGRRFGKHGVRRSGLRDGFGVAGRAAPGIRLHPPRRHTRQVDAGSGAAGRATGQGARQCPRAAGLAAGPGGRRGQLRRRRVGVPMRCVFALTAMGFLPQSADAIDADEMIRVRILPAWLRIDARFGSVYRRRSHAALLMH